VITDVQYAFDAAGLPGVRQLNRWITAAAPSLQEAEVVVRIVGEAESAQLNRRYRRRGGPTNVLSFRFEAPAHAEVNLLGDLVICAPVIAREAREQGKCEAAHWAHMVVHGMLHLQGYDHKTQAQAREMEGLEIEIMASLGYPNPYQ
jgi:probable rRNA maturation factor